MERVVLNALGNAALPAYIRTFVESSGVVVRPGESSIGEADPPLLKERIRIVCESECAD